MTYSAYYYTIRCSKTLHSGTRNKHKYALSVLSAHTAAHHHYGIREHDGRDALDAISQGAEAQTAPIITISPQYLGGGARGDIRKKSMMSSLLRNSCSWRTGLKALVDAS